MKPNILFVNLPTLPLESLRTCFTGKSQIPHILEMPTGLLYLSAYLKAHCEVGNVSLLDYNVNLPNIAQHASVESFILAETQEQVTVTPDIIGISLYFTTAHTFFELLIPALKAKWPKALIVAGGPHATTSTQMVLRNKNLDYVVRGEGEIPFLKLVRQYKSGEPINITGVYAARDFDSSDLRKGFALAEHLESLDDLPFPDWELAQIEKYLTSTGRRRSIGKAENKRVGAIITSRGCPFKCTYCAAHAVHGRTVRFRSIEKVLEEVKILHEKYGVTLFLPADDLFTANKRRTLELLQGLRDLNIPDFELQFPSGLSVNQLDEKMLDSMILCGTQAVNLAIESGSEYVQKHIIKKNVNLKKAKDLVTLCRSKDLAVRGFIIFGFPGETKAMMNETVRFLKELQADWCTLMIATPLHGSEMYDQFLKEGYIREDLDALSHLHFRDRDFDTKEISAVDLKEFIYRVNLDINFVNNPNLHLGRYDMAISLFNDILCTYAFHIFALYGLYVAYKEKNELARAESVREQICSLIKTNEQAQEMFQKYKDLLPPDFVVGLEAAATSAQ